MFYVPYAVTVLVTNNAITVRCNQCNNNRDFNELTVGFEVRRKM